MKGDKIYAPFENLSDEMGTMGADIVQQAIVNDPTLFRLGAINGAFWAEEISLHDSHDIVTALDKVCKKMEFDIKGWNLSDEQKLAAHLGVVIGLVCGLKKVPEGVSA